MTNPIVPFCIFNYIDPVSNTYLGYIGESEAHERTYICRRKGFENQPWYSTGMFWAIDPDVRPIPPEMRIFCAYYKDGFPYNTVQVEIVYDPYYKKPLCTYFIAYVKPVPNTRPLYIYTNGEHIFPTFEPKPPSKYVWQLDRVIHVLDGPHMNFHCNMSRCLPDPIKGTDLGTCMYTCISENSPTPENILDMVQRKEEEMLLSSGRNVSSKHSKYILGIGIILCIILIFISFQ